MTREPHAFGLPVSKDETIRRLRLRDMRNYLRCRYGHTLPDDDAGREDLRKLLYPISVGPNAAIKMPKAIEIWAPWMNTKEAAELIDDINLMPIWLRKPNRRELGERLGVTNQQRQQFRLWTIAPCDLTDQELAEQRKAKDRERKRRSRERQREGKATRAQWLAAHSISRDKPWLLLGISRASYYRKLAKDNPPQVRQVPSAMKLKQHRTQPVSPSKPHVSRAVQATSTPRLNINRKGRSNRTAESVAADATNRPHVLRTQPVSPSDGIAGIGHNAGPPLNSPVDLPEMVDDLSIPTFLRRHIKDAHANSTATLPEAAE
jgi:hypothetical protein